MQILKKGKREKKEKLAVDYENLGKRISWFRNKANYSLELLCEKLDI